MPSKVVFDSEKPSLGHIQVDSVAPPHSATSMKRCILRVETLERTSTFCANLFMDISCKTPLKDSYISILHTDSPGLSANDPMAMVVQEDSSGSGKPNPMESLANAGCLS